MATRSSTQIALRVYVADPRLREATQQAIDMWNQAAGADWLRLTDDSSDARITVKIGTASGKPDPGALARGAGGGQNATGPLTVWVNPQYLTQDEKAGKSGNLLAIITHELGHNLGLEHSAGDKVGGRAFVPDVQSAMGTSHGQPTQRDVQDVLNAQGLGPYTVQAPRGPGFVGDSGPDLTSGPGVWAGPTYPRGPGFGQPLPPPGPSWSSMQTAFDQDLKDNGTEPGLRPLIPYLHTAAMLVARGREFQGASPSDPTSGVTFAQDVYRLARGMQAKPKQAVAKSSNKASSAQQTEIR